MLSAVRELAQPRHCSVELLLSFSDHLATVRDLNGLRCIIKQFLKQILQINEYLITLKNADAKTYRYFLHDLAVGDPCDEGFRIITGANMPVSGSLTGAALRSESPVVFSIKEIMRSRRYAFPGASFWKAAGVEEIMAVRLRVGQEDIGMLWLRAGRTNDRLLSGISAQLAIALANAIANQEIDRQSSELRRHKRGDGQANGLAPVVALPAATAKKVMIGEGAEMQKIYHLLSQVAFASTTVLILGETGTGKELVARALHAASPRAGHPLIKVNCAALPANLIESELFGHEKGSFTGAVDRKLGKFELADKGTLFLDEIGEMPMDVQVKLLRAIQEREIERVGGEGSIKINVRFVAATNRDLEQEVQAGRFRSDLYYRLSVFPVSLPPLRERAGDIPCLVHHFIKKLAAITGKEVAGISDRPLQELIAYKWPGNIRELENTIERAMVMSTGSMIEEVSLPHVRHLTLPAGGSDPMSKTIEDNEREHIIAVLKKCKGKVAGPGGAASFLGIPPSTLNSKMRKLAIKKGQAFGN